MFSIKVMSPSVPINNCNFFMFTLKKNLNYHYTVSLYFVIAIYYTYIIAVVCILLIGSSKITQLRYDITASYNDKKSYL